MVAMSAIKVSSSCWSLRKSKRERVYSSIYFQEVQSHLDRFLLNLTESKERQRERTSSSLDGSKLFNILGNEAQTDPPNNTEAKAIEATLQRVSSSASS